MTSCAECGFDWDCSLAHALNIIEAFPARVSQLLRETGTVEDNTRLRAWPADGVWSPLEYIAHTADVIDWYAGRIARVLTEQVPHLDAFDWDAQTIEQDYGRRLLDDVLDDIRQSCARFTATTVDLDETTWQLTGIGSDGTPRTECSARPARGA